MVAGLGVVSSVNWLISSVTKSREDRAGIYSFTTITATRFASGCSLSSPQLGRAYKDRFNKSLNDALSPPTLAYTWVSKAPIVSAHVEEAVKEVTEEIGLLRQLAD